MRNKIPVVFHNGSNYHYYFIMKKLANEIKGQFECLGENAEKYKTSVLIEKEIRKFGKGGNDAITTVSYKIKFIDSARFTASSLSNFIDNLAEQILKIKCKDRICFFQYESVNSKLIKYFKSVKSVCLVVRLFKQD